MEILFEKNRICTKTIVKKEMIKNKLLELKTSYKKYMTKYINKKYNETFGILLLTSYFLLLKTRLYQENPNINSDIVITYDDENFYIRFNILKFYDRELNQYKNNDQLEVLYNHHFDDNEKEVLNNYIKNIPDEKFVEEKIHIFINLMFNCDEIIKKSKEKVKNNEITLNKMEFEITDYLFGSFALSVEKNLATNKNELLEN